MSNGTSPGRSLRLPSPTPTTRCFRKRSESWPVPLMERVLPRHMQIIYLINAAHLDSARRRGFIDANHARLDFTIDEQAGRRVRMGNLAFIGSHKINGVSALHTDLMRKTACSTALNAVYPGRIVNKTNGITFPPLAHGVQSGARRNHSLGSRPARARRLWRVEGSCCARRRCCAAGACGGGASEIWKTAPRVTSPTNSASA